MLTNVSFRKMRNLNFQKDIPFKPLSFHDEIGHSNGGFWGSGADFIFLTFPGFPGKLGKVESELIKVAVSFNDPRWQCKI